MDVILCDVPFGINHGDLESTKLLYPLMLQEMNRLVCPFITRTSEMMGIVFVLRYFMSLQAK